VGTVVDEDTVPYSEEELAALYPNPQLDANEEFIDYFIKVNQMYIYLILNNYYFYFVVFTTGQSAGSS